MYRMALAASVSLCCVAYSSQSSAQAVNQPAVADTAGSGDIIVTAQRRSERLQDVPISITSLSSDTLRRNNVQQLTDIVKLTPAIRFDFTSDFVQPTIRGVGNSVVSAGAGSNVGIYVDGFYSPNPLASDFQLLNLEGIQVLKGPQGTLFGRNTTGGAILVTSSKPSTTTAGVAEVSYGRFNDANVKGYFTTGITQDIAFDIAADYRHTDGYAINIVDGPKHPGRANDWSVRAGLNIDLSSNSSLLFRYTHQNMSDATNETWGILKQDGVIYAPYQNTPMQLPSSLVPTGYRQVATTQSSQPNFNFKGDIAQMTGNFDLGFSKLTTYTQYRWENGDIYSDADQTAADINFQVVSVRDKTFTQEFLLNSKPGTNFQWTAGLFYFNYIDAFNPVSDGPNRTLISEYYTIVNHSRVQSLAGYVDATYQLGDHLFITAGGRYSHDRFDQASFQFLPYPVENRSPYSGNSFTPRGVIRYQFDPQSSVYASYTRGYKAGLVDVIAGGEVKPEKMDAYEVGFKHSTSRFSIALASWLYNYRDLQVSIYQNGLSQILNAANAKIYGFEGDTHYTILPGLQLNASSAYVHSRFTSFTNAARFEECLDLTTCGASYGMYELVNTNATGNPLPHAPKFTASAGASYGFEAAAGEVVLSGNFYHTSKIYFDAVEQFYQKSYNTVGIRASWTDPSTRYTLAVYGDNLTNSKYINQVIEHSPGIGVVWGAPLTWGVSARVKL